jgi:hypothetical protein
MILSTKQGITAVESMRESSRNAEDQKLSDRNLEKETTLLPIMGAVSLIKR